MGEIMEEFSFLEEQDSNNEQSYEEISKDYITKAQKFINDSNDKTYCGVKLRNLLPLITIGKSKAMNWEHTKFKLDFNYLKDINNEVIKEFEIPDFIEEIEGTGETELGYNQYSINTLKLIKIPRSVLIINPYTFSFYRKLESVIFEDGSRLLCIGDSAFSCCESLHKIDLSPCEFIEELEPNTFINTNITINNIKTSSNLVTYNLKI